MKGFVVAVVIAATLAPCAHAAKLIIEGTYEQDKFNYPVSAGPGELTVKIYLEGVQDFIGIIIPMALKFEGPSQDDSAYFTIKQDMEGGHQPLYYYYVIPNPSLPTPYWEELFNYYYNPPEYPDPPEYVVNYLLNDEDAVDMTTKTLLFTVTYEYTDEATGPYIIGEGTMMVPDVIGGPDIEKVAEVISLTNGVVPHEATVGRTSIGGSTLYVGTSETYTDIQSAINASSDGDIIIVRDGVYTGNGNRDIGFVGKAVILTSENGPYVEGPPSSGVKIDAEASGTTYRRVFSFMTSEKQTSMLSGFTITGGNAQSYGGGIYCYASSPTIVNNVITGNNCKDTGGGVCGLFGGPTIRDNVISQNTANTGGGVSFMDTAATLRENLITGNTASGLYPVSGQGGGGVHLTGGGWVIDNSITDNEAYTGAGVYCWYSSAEIKRNVIKLNNTPAQAWYIIGGGIACYNSSPFIHSNVISRNEADEGGAIHCLESSPWIINNTFAYNRARQFLGDGIFCDSSSLPTIMNSIFWRNGDDMHNCSATYSRFDEAEEDDEDDEATNTSQYPHFVDPDQDDYHLKTWSPCINEGNNAVVPVLPPMDMDGNPRIVFDTVDMGADEAIDEKSDDTDEDKLPDDWEDEHFGNLQQASDGDPDQDGLDNLQEYQEGTDPNVDRSTIYVDDDATGEEDGTIQNPYNTIQEGVDASTGTVLVAGGNYGEEVFIRGKSLTILGGHSSDFSTQDPETYPTTIDPSQLPSPTWARAVTYVNVASGSISGFTITGGDTKHGGGIYCTESSPTITQNVIQGNEAYCGGGIYLCAGSKPQITDNTIETNSARDGGGIACEDSAPTIANNQIGSDSNGNQASRHGGGIYCRSTSYQTAIENNSITFNNAGGKGGGICLYKSSWEPPTVGMPTGKIAANTITDNGARAGAAISCKQCTSCPITGNIIANNQAPRGAAIRLSWSSAEMENNTIVDNSAEAPD